MAAIEQGPQNWSVADVSRWLETVGLGELKAVFERECVDGVVLFAMTESDLRDIGVTALGHRHKFSAAIAALKQNPQTPPQNPLPTVVVNATGAAVKNEVRRQATEEAAEVQILTMDSRPPTAAHFVAEPFFRAINAEMPRNALLLAQNYAEALEKCELCPPPPPLPQVSLKSEEEELLRVLRGILARETEKVAGRMAIDLFKEATAVLSRRTDGATSAKGDQADAWRAALHLSRKVLDKKIAELNAQLPERCRGDTNLVSLVRGHLHQLCEKFREKLLGDDTTVFLVSCVAPQFATIDVAAAPKPCVVDVLLRTPERQFFSIGCRHLHAHDIVHWLENGALPRMFMRKKIEFQKVWTQDIVFAAGRFVRGETLDSALALWLDTSQSLPLWVRPVDDTFCIFAGTQQFLKDHQLHVRKLSEAELIDIVLKEQAVRREIPACVAAVLASEAFLLPRIPLLREIVEECEQATVSISNSPATKALITQHGLASDEVFALVLYTYDVGNKGKASENFYFQLNDILRTRSQEGLAAIQGFMWFASSALRKLPNFKGIVFRGNNAPDIVAREYTTGREIFWSGFTSTTVDLSVARQFAGSGGVVFRIEITSGKVISAFTTGREKEVLLPPNTCLVVSKEMHIETDGVQYVDLVGDTSLPAPRLPVVQQQETSAPQPAEFSQTPASRLSSQPEGEWYRALYDFELKAPPRLKSLR